MELQKFIENFADQFENTDLSIIKPETRFIDLDEWSSLQVLAIIAMADIEYNVKIKADDIRKCSTINDLYQMVKSKLNSDNV